MSDPRQNRFEIDLEEIERQLRRSVETPSDEASSPERRPPPPPTDPLAELARIVGQDDPFRGILGDRPQAEPPKAAASAKAAGVAAQSVRVEPQLTSEDRAILGSAGPEVIDVPAQARADVVYDPVNDAYGSLDGAVDEREFVPMAPPRSRGRLLAVLAVLAVAVLAGAGALMWRKGGSNLASGGAAPVIRADNAPLKVAPENPGGVDIPNQNRQIYDRATPDPKSRVVDRQEQPVDVGAMTRTMPGGGSGGAVPMPVVPPGASGGTNPGAAASGAGPAPQVSASVSGTRPPNAVSSVLGEPRRVRTVTVRPDGSVLPAGASPGPDVPTIAVPSGSLPPPVQVATISIPVNQQGGATSPSTTPSPAGTPSSSTPPVSVLPPARPQMASAAPVTPVPADTGLAAATAPSSALPAGEGTPAPDQMAVQVRPPVRPARIGERVASAPDAATTDVMAPAAAGSTNYVVQIATRNTEGEAQSAYTQLADKYGTDLGGKPAFVAQSDQRGKQVYRVRVGPMSRADANTLCTRLKSSGAACLVTAE